MLLSDLNSIAIYCLLWIAAGILVAMLWSGELKSNCQDLMPNGDLIPDTKRYAWGMIGVTLLWPIFLALHILASFIVVF